jgi:hypothetical protein
VESYIRSMDISPLVDSLWERVGTKMQDKGSQEKDVKKAIRDVRSSG